MSDLLWLAARVVTHMRSLDKADMTAKLVEMRDVNPHFQELVVRLLAAD